MPAPARQFAKPAARRPSRCRLLSTRWLLAGLLAFFAIVAIAHPGVVIAQTDDDAGGRAESSRLTPDQQRDLDLLLGLVGDAKLELPRRRDAAASLLSKGWPGAIDALATELATSTDGTTRRAIAGAVASSDTPPKAMIKPLLGLVGAEDAALRRDVAAALGRYENGGVVERLIEMVNAPPADLPAAEQARVVTGAVDALGEHRVVASVDALIELTRPTVDAALRERAFVSLEHLTGIDDFGEDHQAWVGWWAENRDLPRDRWLARLIRTLGERIERADDRGDALEARFVETMGQLYVARPEDQRPAMLTAMLGDNLTAVRLLALRLIDRKLVNAQPIGEPVREALRRALVDSDPRVRATAASTLRDLDDEKAQAVALERLLAEPEPAVQAAYLSLLSRKVSADAVAPALVLAARPTTRGPAAALLDAATQADLLNDEQKTKARRIVRDHLALTAGDGAALPAPDAVRLLGRLAEAEDAATMAGLLEHTDSAVRSAAADAYAMPALPLEPVLAKLSDPTLGAKAARAAGVRATSLDVAKRVFEATPDDGERASPWYAAVASIAGRLNLTDLQKLDDVLATNDKWAATRVAVLKRVPELPNSAGDRTPLSLRLARLHLDADRHDAAEATYRTIDEAAISDAQRSAYRLGRFELLIDTGKTDEAVKLAGEALADDPALGSSIGRLLLDAAERHLDAKQTEQAAALIAHAQRLAGAALTDTDRTRLDKLRQRLPSDPASSGDNGVG